MSSNIYIDQEISIGYLCCISNESMPGILKINTINDINEINQNIGLNQCDNLEPPTPYKIEIIGVVRDPIEKELALHKLLSKYTVRINPMKKFYRISVEDVKPFFELISFGKIFIQPSRIMLCSICKWHTKKRECCEDRILDEIHYKRFKIANNIED